MNTSYFSKMEQDLATIFIKSIYLCNQLSGLNTVSGTGMKAVMKDKVSAPCLHCRVKLRERTKDSAAHAAMEGHGNPFDGEAGRASGGSR